MDKMTIGSLLLTLVSTAIGVWAYRQRAQADVDRARGEAAAKTEAAPIQILTEQLQRQHQEGMAQRRLNTEMMLKVLQGDRARQDQLIKTLAAQEEALRSLNAQMVDHRAEERARTASFHERLNDIDKGVARIEGKIGYRNGQA